MAVCPAVFGVYVPTLHVSKFVEAGPECTDQIL
jgi:hypothetical protein